jgi:hypothetical protein
MKMACFLVSAAEAVVVTAVEKAEEKREAKSAPKKETVEKIPFSRKLKWLTWLLWGGAILLAFEHVWHGEVVPWFPFLTAMSDPEDKAEMFHEMATIGVTMAVLVTVAWIGICLAADAIMKRKDKPVSQKA